MVSRKCFELQIDLFSSYISCLRFQIQFGDFNWERQEVFLRQTVDCPVVLQCPLKYKYQLHFLKVLISVLEREGVEVHDDFYTNCCRLLSDLNKSGADFYKHYKVGDCLISLKESESFVSEGTTGLCSWQVRK